MPDPSVRALGRRIARRRLALGLSQTDLAERLGLMSPETVSRYERGEREPRYTTLRRLAESLGMTIGALCDEVDVNGVAPVVAEAISGGDAVARLIVDLRSLQIGAPEEADRVASALLAVLGLVHERPRSG